MLKNQHNGQMSRMELNIKEIHFRGRRNTSTPTKEAKSKVKEGKLSG